MIAANEPSPEMRALTWAVITAAASAAAAALVTWFMNDAERRLASRPCRKCHEREGEARR